MTDHVRQEGGTSVMESEEAPQLLEKLVRSAEKASASDIHLLMRPEGAEVTFRVDGVMVPYTRLSKPVGERVAGRVKFLAAMRTYQESYPQDGRIEKDHVGSSQDIRVATYPTITGEKLNLRLFAAAGNKSLPELGLASETHRALEQVLNEHAGLLLLTGPSGSGKTTTIYACLRYLTDSGRHIITIEDPVEHLVPGTMQTEINEARGLGFPQAVKHVVRQDPDILVLGEVRDEETADMAVRIAFTGHLVIATLHAGSCQGVFERLRTMTSHFPTAIAATKMVLNQRLIRCLCPNCRGTGCKNCLQTGYRGRLPLAESVRMTDSLRETLRGQGISTIEPDKTLEQRGKELVQTGITNEQELKRVLRL